jgi:seryl-tRNA synthetase
MSIDTTKKPLGNKPNTQNLILVALVGLLVVALFFIAYMSTNSNKLRSDSVKNKKMADSLERQVVTFNHKIDSLNDESKALKKQMDNLLTQKEKLIQSRDSLTRLLNFSRTNERNATGKVAMLEKQLRDMQVKLNDVQKKYEEASQFSQTTDEELQRQLQAVKAERDALATQLKNANEKLQKTENEVKNPLTMTTLKGTPGELKSGKFDVSTRSTRTDRVQVVFNMNRPLEAGESLNFRIFDNAEKEIPLKPSFRTNIKNTLSQTIILEFANGYLPTSASGNFSVRAYQETTDKSTSRELQRATFNMK